MEIKIVSAGYLQTNCYIISGAEHKAVVIDPGGGYDKIKSYLAQRNLTVEAILLTHGHFDHIMALAPLKKEGAKVYIHEADVKMLQNKGNLAVQMGLSPLPEIEPDVILYGGEILTFGDLEFKVIHTPGHTKGGCCYDLNKTYLFSGDTLFFRSYGRTDFPSGSSAELLDSIKKLFDIDGDRIVYPGHEESTTLNEERRYNPALAEL